MIRATRLFATVLLAAACGPTQAPVLAFTGATIIDGTGRPAISDAILVVDGERIVALGSQSQVDIPDRAVRYDLRGKWIIPGMVDAHVHFWESARPGGQPTLVADLRAMFPWNEEVAWMKRRVPFTLSRYICSGVTSVIALGAIDWEYDVRALAERQVDAPRVFLAAGLFSAEPVAGAFPIFDGEQTGRYAGTPDSAVALLNDLANRPSDLVKIGGLSSPDYPIVRARPVVEALIEAAHARGLRVSVHATDLERAQTVLAWGADHLAHPVSDTLVDSAFIAAASHADVTVTSTVSSDVGFLRLLAPRFELESPERSCGDPEVIADWDRWVRTPRTDRPALPSWIAESRPAIERSKENVRRLHAAGVAIAVGSDGGNIGTMHGPGFHRELRILAEVGIPLMDIIVAATRNGARVAGKEQDLGTLEPGKLADFVVLDADPLADIANLDRITQVFVRGRLIERAGLLRQR